MCINVWHDQGESYIISWQILKVKLSSWHDFIHLNNIFSILRYLDEEHSQHPVI